MLLRYRLFFRDDALQRASLDLTAVWRPDAWPMATAGALLANGGLFHNSQITVKTSACRHATMQACNHAGMQPPTLHSG
jgi:hypothetical protein